eukprot:sb/3474248/
MFNFKKKKKGALVPFENIPRRGTKPSKTTHSTKAQSTTKTQSTTKIQFTKIPPQITNTPARNRCGDKKLKQWEEQDDQENRNTLNQTYTLQNDLLKPAKTPDIDTEVLQLEEELDRWESFYNSNSELFELIRRWNNLNER